jgi:hypothetical protein
MKTKPTVLCTNCGCVTYNYTRLCCLCTEAEAEIGTLPPFANETMKGSKRRYAMSSGASRVKG